MLVISPGGAATTPAMAASAGMPVTVIPDRREVCRIGQIKTGFGEDHVLVVNTRVAGEPHELERLYPRTVAELFSWGKSWQETCQRAFADLGVDPQRVREVAALIPGAMRGLVSERQLGSYADLDEARRGLTNALATYLEQSRLT